MLPKARLPKMSTPSLLSKCGISRQVEGARDEYVVQVTCLHVANPHRFPNTWSNKSLSSEVSVYTNTPWGSEDDEPDARWQSCALREATLARDRNNCIYWADEFTIHSPKGRTCGVEGSTRWWWLCCLRYWCSTFPLTNEGVRWLGVGVCHCNKQGKKIINGMGC